MQQSRMMAIFTKFNFQWVVMKNAMGNSAPALRAAALCFGHRAIRCILGGACGHFVPPAPPKDAAPIAGADAFKSTFLLIFVINTICCSDWVF
jgi:hypothetical protein